MTRADSLATDISTAVTVKAVGHDHLCIKLKKERISDNPTMPDEDDTYLLVY